MARTRWPPGPGNPGLLHRPGRSDRQRRWVPKKPGPGRQIVSQDSQSGVSRLAGQAGTQATDPTPPLTENLGGGTGALPTSSLPSLRGFVSVFGSSKVPSRSADSARSYGDWILARAGLWQRSRAASGGRAPGWASRRPPPRAARLCCAWRRTAATASARPDIRRAPCSPASWPSACTRSAWTILTEGGHQMQQGGRA
jgi:hypothetical protein